MEWGFCLLEDFREAVGLVGEEDFDGGVVLGLVAGDAGQDEVGDTV
jgi:hypothetical protein